ncbi:hypothetical protein GCM10011607_12680 [Shewanella inventionis]|uniref:Uncharacterized protein n=1 Tax=Shewanella inventionis TaxID=1738770 RepID=A0ABQ1IYI1_9GAMM|nr:hypothetical protein [Shewanella inventionis]GGB53580.1 hypothetical protein GCM10011607_12680 [Shewanella inventionis]
MTQVPTDVSRPIGALHTLDLAVSMLDGCSVLGEKDQGALNKIVRRLINMRDRQLSVADRAYSDLLKEVNR